MTAYRLMENKPELQMLMVEKGHGIKQRSCPIVLVK